MSQPSAFPPAERLTGKGSKVAEHCSPPTLPLSLSMGPTVIYANAAGDPEAQAIVAAWQPRFKVMIVSHLAELAWQ